MKAGKLIFGWGLCSPHSPSWWAIFSWITIAPAPSLLSGVPKNLNYNSMKELMLAVEGVVSVHSLHVWSLTMNQAIVSVHVAAGQWVLSMPWTKFSPCSVKSVIAFLFIELPLVSGACQNNCKVFCIIKSLWNPSPLSMLSWQQRYWCHPLRPTGVDRE